MELYEKVNAKLTDDDNKDFKISHSECFYTHHYHHNTLIIYKLVIYFLIQLCVRIFLF